MATIEVNGTKLYYEIHGVGRETMLMSHGLLWSGKMFEAQVEYFKSRFKVVIYDHRGQGRSEVSEGGYDMDNLAKDAAALIEALDLGPCHFVGLSMGGFVGMRLAARRPELLKSLTLMETSADPEVFKSKYNLLTMIVKLFGVKVVTGKVMPIMFGKTFLTDSSRATEREKWTVELQSNQKTIVRAVKGVIDRQGVYDEISVIHLPTLVLVGDEDVATPRDKAERIHKQIEGSKLQVIKNAGHSSCIEEPQQVIMEMEKFLNRFSFS